MEWHWLRVLLTFMIEFTSRFRFNCELLNSQNVNEMITYPMMTEGTIISIAIMRKQRPLKSKCCTVSEYKELKTAAPISVQRISTVATAANKAP